MKPNDPKGLVGAAKTPLVLVPAHALEQVAWAHRLGADKYGPYNWRETGVCATTYISAMMRHLNAWRDGEDVDPESGITHLAHIACNANILMDAMHCGTLQDDRYRIPVQEKAEISDCLVNYCSMCGYPLEQVHTMGLLCPKCDF